MVFQELGVLRTRRETCYWIGLSSMTDDESSSEYTCSTTRPVLSRTARTMRLLHTLSFPS
jgi:hypothetical protein